MRRVSDDSTKTLLKNLIRMQVGQKSSSERVESISGVHISVLRETLKNPEILQILLQDEFSFKGIIDSRVDSDSLEKSWFDVSFVIPDFSNMFAWTRKAVEEMMAGRIVVLLAPVKTTSQWFHTFILDRAQEIRFLRDTLRLTTNGPEIAVCIAIYRPGTENKYKVKSKPVAISRAKISFTETDVVIENQSLPNTKYLSALE